MQWTDEQFAQLVDLYQTPLRRMCCMWLHDAALAEDAVQETFLRAYRALPSFRGDCSEKTWLCHIAVNVCHNLRRSQWFRFVDRSVDIERLSAVSAPPVFSGDPLLHIISALPLRQREVVLLYYYQDMTLAEIAQTLSTTPSTISRRLKAARKTLRMQLERE